MPSTVGSRNTSTRSRATAQQTRDQLRAARRQQEAISELALLAIEALDESTVVTAAESCVARTLDVERCAILEHVPNKADQPVGISIALHGQKPAYAFLNVYAAHDRVFTAQELRFLRTVAHIVGAAIQRSRADAAHRQDEAHLRHRAFHDLLTGLPNRALFADRLRHAVSRAQRERAPVAILFMDLDEFKTINDTFGHAVGDDVLRQVADRLGRCLREGDTAARLGGDEFAVVLEQATESEAADVARRISEAMVPPMRIGGLALRVGASLGIAAGGEDANSIEALVERADAAMYAAKRHSKALTRIGLYA